MGMFNGFLKFIQKVTSWFPDKELEEIIEVESKDITNAVKLQLAKGIDGNGEPVYLIRYGIKHYQYARYTQWRKDIFGQGLGSETDHVTNYMTGNFYDSLFVEAYPNGGFEVKSTSPLIGIIKFRSGADIINLSPESERFLFQEKMAPLIQQEINELFYE